MKLKIFKMFKILNIFSSIILLIIPGIFVDCVPVEYDVGNESYDLDTEQSEARYDPRLLSEELRGSHSESQQGAEACISSDSRYEHGQKISRSDPCEVCLCVDGEVFCWWKQCDYPTKKPTITKSYKNHKNRKISSNFTRKNVKNFPKGILTFPMNLPVHLPILDLNNNGKNNNSDSSIKNYHTDFGNDHVIISSSIKTPSSSDSTDFLSQPTFLSSSQTQSLSTTTVPITSQKSLVSTLFIPISTNINTGNIQNTTESIINTTKTNNIIPEKGYYEKSIINRDGLFIENIHKIPLSYDENLNSNNDLNSEEDDLTSVKHIKIDDITAGQHYVITSSGNVENTDSDSVLTQFKNNFIDFTSATTTSLSTSLTNSTNSNFINSNQNSNLNQTTIDSNINKVTSSDDSFASITTDSSIIQTKIASSTTMMTSNIEQECIVMGISYKIGTILPQETGNCLQCICIEGATPIDPPRVTCNPHNCPPLVLPDLFDTTGY